MNPIRALTIGLLTLLPFTQQGYAEEIPNIAVSASGKVLVKPDMAEFTVIIQSEGKNAVKAASETAEKQQRVQQALKASGIAAEDIATRSYTVSPRWEWNQAQSKNQLVGYTARHSMEVTVRMLSTIGKSIDAAVQAGANEIQNITYSASNAEELRQKALALAVSNARADAAIMAQAAGGKLGSLLDVSVSQPAPMPRAYMMDTMALKAAPAAVATEIAPAEQEITVSVSSRWQFSSPSQKSSK